MREVTITKKDVIKVTALIGVVGIAIASGSALVACNASAKAIPAFVSY